VPPKDNLRHRSPREELGFVGKRRAFDGPLQLDRTGAHVG
jgi:hypothetical protein